MNFHLATFTSEANRAINKHKKAGRQAANEREWAAVFYIRFVYTFLHFPKQSFFFIRRSLSDEGLPTLGVRVHWPLFFVGLFDVTADPSLWAYYCPSTYYNKKGWKRNRLARKVRLKISSVGKEKMQYEANFQFHLKHKPFLLSFCLKLIFCILYNTYILQDECTY